MGKDCVQIGLCYHKQFAFFDFEPVSSHLDLAWNGLFGGRDLRQSVLTIRAAENGPPYRSGQGTGTVALPELRRGRVALACATLLARSTGTPVPHVDFRSAVQARGSALGQLYYYRGLEQLGEIRVITDLQALTEHVAEWEAWEAAQDPYQYEKLYDDNDFPLLKREEP